MMMCNFLIVEFSFRSIDQVKKEQTLQAAPPWCSGLERMPRMRKVGCSNSGCDRHVVTIPVLKSLATDLITRVGNSSPISQLEIDNPLQIQ